MLRPSIPVLCYHNTCPPDGHTPQQLARHLDCIRDMGFSTLGASQIVDAVKGKNRVKYPAVGITFDDGHVSNWLYALPLLKTRNMRATFFVCTDFIGSGSLRTTEKCETKSGAESFFRATVLGDREQFLNKREIQSLGQEQLMEVLPHSAAHACCFIGKETRPAEKKENWCCHRLYGREVTKENLPCFKGGSAYARSGGWWPEEKEDGLHWRTPEDNQRYRFCLEDFQRSKTTLEDLLGKKIHTFCWPWGEYDPLSEKALVDAGFSAAFTLERGVVGPGIDPLRIGRIPVSPRKSLGWLKTRLRLLSRGPSARWTFKEGQV